MKTKAAVLVECGRPRPFARSKPIEILELDLDPPGEGEVLVKVGGAGLCHSDLSLVNGDRPRPTPVVLGHEGSGEIVEVGKGVHDVKAGDHVCFTFNVSCGRCRRCLEGRPYICERSVTPRAAGQLLSGHHRLHLDGKPVNHQSGVSCYAEYAVVDRGSIVVIDKSLPLDLAALFGCAVVTGVGAVVNTGRIEAGSTVAVVGLGGVGLSGLLGAVLRTSRFQAEERAIAEHARELLDYVGIGGYADYKARTLSYGDQRRLEVARALALRPKVLLLDEPMAGMNVEEKQDMCRFILDVNDEFGTTIVLIEHDMGVVMDISDRVVVLDYGKKIVDGSPDEVRNNEEVISAYLGTSH